MTHLNHPLPEATGLQSEPPLASIEIDHAETIGLAIALKHLGDQTMAQVIGGRDGCYADIIRDLRESAERRAGGRLFSSQR